MTLPELFMYISDGGVIGLLILAVVGGFRRWYVFGWQYDMIVKERDEWKHAALRATGINEKVLDVAQATTRMEKNM